MAKKCNLFYTFIIDLCNAYVKDKCTNMGSVTYLQDTFLTAVDAEFFFLFFF